MNLKLMALNIKEFCPGLSIPLIKQRINVRYKQILEKEDWVFLNDSEVVTLPERVSNSSTESCIATFGSTTITGTGTSWSSSIEGKLFRIGGDAQFYRVSSVTSNTELELEVGYAQDTVSGEDFEYWNEYYSPSSSEITKIKSVVYQSELVEKPNDYIQRLDPERTSTGSPVYYSVVSKVRQGGVGRIDIWPVPDDNYGVRVYYKKTVSGLSSNSDEPVFDAALLESGALWDCFRLSFGLTQNPAFIGLARDARLEYSGLLRETIIEDLRNSSLPDRVRYADDNTLGYYNDEYALDHGIVL
ncbi:MAG: hypothetical protein GY841_22055 [FCB group bacterium]|nr:hypothetical protein [FCB group bacterium]